MRRLGATARVIRRANHCCAPPLRALLGMTHRKSRVLSWRLRHPMRGGPAFLDAGATSRPFGNIEVQGLGARQRGCADLSVRASEIARDQPRRRLLDRNRSLPGYWTTVAGGIGPLSHLILVWYETTSQQLRLCTKGAFYAGEAVCSGVARGHGNAGWG